MFASTWTRRPLHVLVAALTLSAVAACSDDDPVAPPEEEPEIQTVTLTVGASSITIDKTTGAASGQLVVPAGPSTVTAVWKKADGSIESIVTSDEFDLKFAPTNPANLTWTAAGAFGGTLTTSGLTSGQTTTAGVSLFHKEEQHDDFGPYTITIRVQ
jgi:hypothetical protein